MSLNKEFFNRETNISAKVICDSISEQGVRITTFEVEAPRIILAEINTHNAISKNCSSTRAITLEKAINQVQTNGFTPLYWGEKKAGMSADKELDNITLANLSWETAKHNAVNSVKTLDSERLHKQIAGRLLEPFQMVKQVLTATDFDNFFNLRIHPTSQPEICMLAYKMHQAMQDSNPVLLRDGEFHLPYIERYNAVNPDNTDEVIDDAVIYMVPSDSGNGWMTLSLQEAIKISASCCAQVSYRNTDMSLEKADKIFNMLVKADVLHASCFEHLATPIVEKFNYFDEDDLDSGYEVNLPHHIDSWEEGITHVNRNGELCSGNLRGWISYRHLLPKNTCWSYDHEERMKSFN